MKKYTTKSIYMYDNITGELVREFKSQTDAERSLGLYRGAVGDALKGKNNKHKLLFSREKYDKFALNTDGINTEKKQASASIQLSTLSEKDLREKHDMYYIIQSFISKIPEGEYIEETSMLRHLSLWGKPRYREALARIEKDNKGKVDGTTYYGSITSIRKLKQEGVLQ